MVSAGADGAGPDPEPSPDESPEARETAAGGAAEESAVAQPGEDRAPSAPADDPTARAVPRKDPAGAAPREDPAAPDEDPVAPREDLAGAAPQEEPVGAAPRGGPALAPAGGQPPQAPPRRRHSKILAWTAGIAAAVLAAAAIGGYAVYRHLNGNLHQVDISGIIGSQPVNHHPQAENIMVIGSDTRVGQSRRYGNSLKLTGAHSDTLLIVHIAANRKWADIVSIPRDSWVNIPSCRMGNGQTSSPTTFKINEAFAIGNLDGNNIDLGVACTIKTLEHDTGIPINHFVAVNFAGFQAMVNALGGVPECNSAPINDPRSGLRLGAGHHLLHGRQALAYVRARYTLGNGSDLERITRQQAFMSSLVDRVKSKLLNPVAIYRFLDAATKSLSVDNKLGGLPGLYNLAMSVKNMRPSQVTFFTLPTYPRAQVDPADTADVMWTQPEDSLIFQAFRNDVPVTEAMLHPPRPHISPASVSLTVLNGTQNYGLQDTVASLLQQDGFKVAGTGVAHSTNVTETVVRYHAGQLDQARLLASKIHGAAIQETPGAGPITLVLGSNYGSTAHPGPGPSPEPASSFAPRTASQNICT